MKVLIYILRSSKPSTLPEEKTDIIGRKWGLHLKLFPLPGKQSRMSSLTKTKPFSNEFFISGHLSPSKVN